MKFLIIDNYDSFVYNIAQSLGQINIESLVYRNDKINLKDIKRLNIDAIIISPGPGNPEDRKYFGICNSIIKTLGKETPILGICLGHQGIVSAFGGKINKAGKTRHGKTSQIYYKYDPLFENVNNPFIATRYHSLIADRKTFPNCLEITANSVDDNEIMAITHKHYPIKGVQFHPESILTNEGMKILNNFTCFVKK
ncbi:MAG: aminodeoxychorismate/anthranilate synthase component II [Nitrososphaeraceae archaeon]